MNHGRGKLGLWGCSEDFGAQEEELRLVVELRLRSSTLLSCEVTCQHAVYPQVNLQASTATCPQGPDWGERVPLAL